MGFWAYLALWVITFAITVALTPKPEFENAKAAKLGDFRFPKTEEGSPVPLWWGRLRLRAPNVLWYGDLEARPIFKKVKTGLFSSKLIIIGYRYFLGMTLGIGIPTGGTTTVRKIWFGEKLAWSGSVSVDGTAIVIDEPSLFGGRENGGGVIGTIRFYTGSFTQAINTYLQGVVPDSTLLPAYHGMCYAVLEHVELGESPSIRTISFEVETIPNSLALGGIGTDGDANPAEVAYDIIVSEWGRLGISTSAVDSTSFTTVGTTLNTEVHGISLAVQSSNTGKDILEEILKQVDGIVYENPITKKIQMRLIRDDFDIETIPEFDETNVLEIVDWGKSTWKETVNHVRVIYNDRSNNYTQRAAVAQDMANIEFQGQIRNALINFPGITNGILANKVAARGLSAMSIPIAKMSIAVNRDGSSILPGDAIKISWSDYGIVQIVMRITRYDLGELDDSRVVLDLVQDNFSVKDTIYGDPPATGFISPVTDATAASIRKLLDTPRWLNLKAITADLAVDADSSHVLHMAVQPTLLEISFEAQVSEDAGVTYGSDVVSASFCHSALVDTIYVEENAPYDTTVGLILKSITDSSILGSATDADIRSLGDNLILVGDELMSYGSFTDLGGGDYKLNNVWRGLLDTVPIDHAVDERIWFLAELSLEAYGEGEFVGDEVLKARFLTNTGFDILAEGDATVDNLTLAQRSQRPYCPADIQIGASRYPTSKVGQVQTVSWKRRDRVSAAIARGDDADETPTATEEYLISWSGDQSGSKVMGSGTSDSVDFGGLGSITVVVSSRFTGPGLVSHDSWSWTLTLT